MPAQADPPALEHRKHLALGYRVTFRDHESRVRDCTRSP
jgi:hypothetical protein